METHRKAWKSQGQGDSPFSSSYSSSYHGEVISLKKKGRWPSATHSPCVQDVRHDTCYAFPPPRRITEMHTRTHTRESQISSSPCPAPTHTLAHTN